MSHDLGALFSNGAVQKFYISTQGLDYFLTAKQYKNTSQSKEGHNFRHDLWCNITPAAINNVRTIFDIPSDILVCY